MRPPEPSIAPIEQLRVVVANGYDVQRLQLISSLARAGDVDVVAAVATGREALAAIQEHGPDVAYLDVALTGLTAWEVWRKSVVRKKRVLFVFMGRGEAEAARAFDANALDYLVIPVANARLRLTIDRAKERLELMKFADEAVEDAKRSADRRAGSPARLRLRRIPVRCGDSIVLVPEETVVSIVAHGANLHLTTSSGERHVISYRLKDLEVRLDPALFIRISIGTLVNINYLERVAPLPAGLMLMTLNTGQQYRVSRIRTRLLRESLLKL